MSTSAVDYLLRHPDSDATAVVHGERAISHRELAARTEEVARFLRAGGLGAGDVLALIADNSIDWVVWYLATLRCGATVMPLSGRESPRFLERALGLANLHTAVVDSSYSESISTILAKRPRVALRGAERTDGMVGPRGLGLDPEPGFDARTATAAIMMTSGSTGDPRGVRVSHRNIEANTRSILGYLHLDPRDRMMVVLPFSYCFGLSLLHTHLSVGGSVVIDNRFMFPDRVLGEMERTGCTGLAGVPSTFRNLLRRSSFERGRCRALARVLQAGGRMPPDLIRELREALRAEAQIFVMYGATEATARLTFVPPACLMEKIGSVGVPIPGVQLEARDPVGRAVGVGEIGELYAKGDNVALGYVGDDEQSARHFVDGWLRTGDLGRIDADGFWWLEGRREPFIKSFGFRVSPREIEDVIYRLHGVAEVVVRGDPDDEAGEAIVAHVVPAPASGLTETDVLVHCRRALPNQKVPVRVQIIAEIPKTASGKDRTADLR